MSFKVAIVLALCLVTLTSAKEYKLEKDDMKFKIDLYSDGAKFNFQVPYSTVDKSMVFHLKGDTDCPGYAYWFSKDNMNLPALSLSSACESGEQTVRIRYEIGVDFAKRNNDAIDGTYWKFDGQLFYEKKIDHFDIDKYTKIRIIRRGSSGTSDQTYDL